jgi:hypothetical protein
MWQLRLAASIYTAITLMMEGARTSEASVNIYKTIRRKNPEDGHLHRKNYLAKLTLEIIQNSASLKYTNKFQVLDKNSPLPLSGRKQKQS